MAALASWLLRETRRDTHSHVSVFVGPDADHRALAGVLILRPEQADELFLMLGPASGRRRIEVQRAGGS